MFDFGDESLYRPWGELFETQLGKMLDQNKQKSDNTSCRYLANINVQWGYFDLTDLKSMTFNEKEIEKFALNVNDLLICEGGDAGRCAVWKESNSEIKYQKAIHRARPIDGSIIDVNYVQYYLHYYKKSGKLADFITKGTIEHLTGEKLNKVPVLVPPIDLQHQFTAFVEQADKSGFVVSKSRFIEMFKHVYADGNVKTLAELVQDDRPITYGVIKPGAFVETGTYLVKVKDMCDGKINVDGLVKITPEVDSMYSRSKLKEGDILLSIRGTVGRVVIVPKELEGANITQDTARISLKIGLNNYYVKCVLESPTIQDWISMHICGLAVKGINLADVRKIPIPMADDSLQKDYVNIYHQADKSGLVN